MARRLGVAARGGGVSMDVTLMMGWGTEAVDSTDGLPRIHVVIH